jgi:hypothetical protein
MVAADVVGMLEAGEPPRRCRNVVAVVDLHLRHCNNLADLTETPIVEVRATTTTTAVTTTAAAAAAIVVVVAAA